MINMNRDFDYCVWTPISDLAQRRSALGLKNCPFISISSNISFVKTANRQLRASTANRRVHSLFRQGYLLYDLIPTTPEQRLRPLAEKYAQMLGQNDIFTRAFGLA